MIKMHFSLVIIITIALLSTNTWSFFGPGSIKLTHSNPPAIKLEGVNRIAIMPLKYDQRDRVLNKVSSLLQKTKPGNIEMVERDQLDMILREQNLAATDLIDADTAPEFGALQGVDVLITGTVNNFDVNKEKYKETVEWTETYKLSDGTKKKEKKSEVVNAERMNGSFSVTFKIVSVSTGAILGQQTYSSKVTHNYVPEPASKPKSSGNAFVDALVATVATNKPLPDEGVVRAKLIDDAIGTFHAYLFPYYTTVDVDLDDDCKADECKEVIDLLKAGMYDMADQTLNAVLEKALGNTKKRKKEQGQDKTLAAIYYHLGVVQESKGNIEGALDFYKKATMARIKKKAGHLKKAVDRANSNIARWNAYNAM